MKNQNNEVVKKCKQCKKVLVGKSKSGLCKSCFRKNTSRLSTVGAIFTVLGSIALGLISFRKK